ncbi:hypothetical protein FRC02_006557 [Tulasnella sp. 418]|nr:hypothetical protein FRC02_006557 [Tulasnella sp. 418]
MAPTVLYHCTCISASVTPGAPPSVNLPSSSYAFHPLHALFFCEECDLVRCNRCVAVEVSGYYCPNCLFEVPSASVRAEKNRCARNCFQCPHCHNTLSVVPSDPASAESDTTGSPVVGEAPYFLYCNFCRWDSAEVGITFDKPTGLALQLQKLEDSFPDLMEFERLKEHFEPIIRSSSTNVATSHHAYTPHHNPITAAASSALARDIPGLRRSTIGNRGVAGQAKSSGKKGADEATDPLYRSRIEVAAGMGLTSENEVEWLKMLDNPEPVADLEQRWVGSWFQSMKASNLKPLRMPLHSKKSKRCSTCRHILIKPEQKAQSVRYKIKLMAANYLPSITATVTLPTSTSTINTPSTATSRSKAKPPPAEDDPLSSMLQPGKTYPFQITFTNPLYDPIQVRLTVHRSPPPPSAISTSASPTKVRAPFAITLPSTSIPISAFAEAWEYEDDDDDEMFDEDDLEEMLSGGASGASKPSGKKAKALKGNVGVLERKANVTKVGGEVLISREGTGDVKFNLQVSYTYRADDPATHETGTKSKSDSASTGGTGEMKTFSFYTVVNLGPITPKEAAQSQKASGTQA